MDLQLTKKDVVIKYNYKIIKFDTKEVWNVFKGEHYLKNTIPSNNKCYALMINDEFAAFCSIGVMPHPRKPMYARVGRLVTLPKYQGLGLGYMLLEYVTDLWTNLGYECAIATSLKFLHKKLAKHNEDWGLIYQANDNAGRTEIYELANTIMVTSMRNCYVETHVRKLDPNRTVVSRTKIPKEDQLDRYCRPVYEQTLNKKGELKWRKISY